VSFLLFLSEYGAIREPGSKSNFSHRTKLLTMSTYVA